MKKRIMALALALCLVLGLAGCGPDQPQESPKAQQFSVTWFDLFDTVTIIQGFAADEQQWDEQMDRLHAELLEYHQLYDIYNAYEGMENLYTINQKAGQGPVKADEKILDLLELALELYGETDGRINVAMGSVLSIWHDAREIGMETPELAYLPDMAELEAAAAHCDPADVVIDRQAGTVELLDPEMRLDVGSIAKGYAAEMGARLLREQGLESAMLSLGGNLCAVGTKPDGAQWTGGIQDPDNTENYLKAVYLEDMALVTSGDYQRFYMVDGQRMHHIIDPDTLMPTTYCRSVTVLNPDSGRSDGYSTALFCMDPQEGLAMVEALEDTEALWVLPDGSILESSGFESHVRQ